MTTTIKLMLEDGSIETISGLRGIGPHREGYCCYGCNRFIEVRHEHPDGGHFTEDRCSLFDKSLCLCREGVCILAQGRYEGAQMKDDELTTAYLLGFEKGRERNTT